MPQRILWITDRYPPAKGGMAVSCARQVRGLRRRGVAVDVLLVGTPFAMDVRIEERDGGSDIYVPQDPESSLAPNQAWLLVRERHARRPYTNVAGFGASEAGYRLPLLRGSAASHRPSWCAATTSTVTGLFRSARAWCAKRLHGRR